VVQTECEHDMYFAMIQAGAVTQHSAGQRTIAAQGPTLNKSSKHFVTTMFEHEVNAQSFVSDHLHLTSSV
jgi:hypothetical protein